MSGNLSPPNHPSATSTIQPDWVPPPLPARPPTPKVAGHEGVLDQKKAAEIKPQQAASGNRRVLADLNAPPSQSGGSPASPLGSHQGVPAGPQSSRRNSEASEPTSQAGNRYLVLLAGVSAALIVTGAAAFFYMDGQHKRVQAEVELKSAELAKKVAAEQLARAEAERKAADLAAQLATKKAQELAQPVSQEPATAATVAQAPPPPLQSYATPSLAAVSAGPFGELAGRYAAASAIPQIQAMLIASSANDDTGIEIAAQKISELPGPARGDRKLARALNQEGLSQLQRSDNTAAAESFLRAALIDPADPEIVGNISHAYLKAGNYGLAAQAAMLSLALTPRRASSWGTLALVTAKSSPEGMPVAIQAYKNAYRYAGSQDKARDYLQKLASEDDDASVRRLAENVTASLPTLRSLGSDASRALGR